MTDIRGDEEAFRRWAGERQLALLRTALLLTGDHHRAEDLVQEALTKVALRWRRLASGNPEAYARRIIVRDNISWWRKRHGELVSDAPAAAAVAPDRTAATERRLMLDGPNWPNVAGQTYIPGLRAIILPNVIGVSTRTLPMELPGAWTVQHYP